MYKIVLGQEGDDYEAGAEGYLRDAITRAEEWLAKIRENQLPTYVYILSPDDKQLSINEAKEILEKQ